MNIIKRKEYLIVFIGILLFGILAAVLFDLPIVREGIVFSLYTILGMLIPGCAAIELLRLDIKTDVEHITYALFLGYIISFLEYFLIVPFGIQKYGFVIALLVSILSIVYLIKKGDSFSLEKDISGFWICLAISVVYIGIRFLTTGGAGSIPIRVDEVNTDWDTFVWVGNTIELTHHFPPGNFRRLGAFFRYHYFSSLQLASTSIVTGISPLVLSQFFYFLVSSLMLVLGGYCAFAKCSKNAILRAFAVFAFIFTSGYTTWTRNIYAEMLFVRPFAIDYGLGMFMFVVFLIAELFEAKRYDNKVIIEILSFALLCGIKANYGSIAIAGIGLCSLKWIFQKEQRWKAFVIGLLNLLVFVLIYYFVTNITGYTGSFEREFVGSDILNHGDTAKVYEGLCNLPISDKVVKPIFLFIYCFLSHPLVFGTVYFQIIRSLITKQKLSVESWIIFALMMIASGIRVFVGMRGTSETYFIYSAYPLGIMFMLLNWKKQSDWKAVAYVVKMACFFSLLMVSTLYNFRRRGTNYIADRAILGIKNITGYSNTEIDTEKTYVTKKQIEAYEWIRDNTEKDDVISVVSNMKVGHTAGVWSERYIYAAQEDKIFEKGFNLNNKTFSEIVEDVGASYVVYIPDDVENLDSMDSEPFVFRNDAVVIYEL